MVGTAFRPARISLAARMYLSPVGCPWIGSAISCGLTTGENRSLLGRRLTENRVKRGSNGSPPRGILASPGNRVTLGTLTHPSPSAPKGLIGLSARIDQTGLPNDPKGPPDPGLLISGAPNYRRGTLAALPREIARQDLSRQDELNNMLLEIETMQLQGIVGRERLGART